MKEILYIEDDMDFAEVIKDYLEGPSYSVDLSYDGIEAIKMSKSNNYDLILCDLNLGSLNGNQVIEVIKKHNPLVKVILLTCSDDQNDELYALRVGADDFINKNTSFEILLERIKKLLDQDSIIKNINTLESKKDKIKVDIKNRIIEKDGEIIELTKIELDLLIYFLSNKNKLLPRKQIYEDVWHVPLDMYDIDLRNIDAHVKNLRKKAGISSITTIRGIGYRWYE